MKKVFVVVAIGIGIFFSPTIWGGQVKPTPEVSLKDWCDSLGQGLEEGPAAHYYTQTYVADDLRNGHFMELAHKVAAWKKDYCYWNDGHPKMSALLMGYQRAFNKETDWSVNASRVSNLKKTYPQTDFAALAEAKYWIDYAWNARGNGFASSVTPDGWKLFRERMQIAEKVLTDSKSYASSLPGWYEQMIIVQNVLDRPEKDIDKTFIEGANKYKTYLPIYKAMGNYMYPKWGGSWEMYDNLVNWSVENTKATEGDSFYARLYIIAGSEMRAGEDLFKVTKASWAKMKKGFDDLIHRYPLSMWNLNNYAAFACRANDKKTFLILREKIGPNIIGQAWASDYSLDLCDHKLGYAKGDL